MPMPRDTPAVVGHKLASQSDAAEAAGSFLDNLGKTDLATMEVHEWTNFIGYICDNYEIALKKRKMVLVEESEVIPF